MSEKIHAVINGKTISDSDLNRIIERYPVDKRIYFETDEGRKQLLEQKVAFSAFSKYACEHGIDKSEDFINKISDIKEQILTQMVLAETLKTDPVSDDEAKKFYNENSDKFALEETVSVKHILVDSEIQAESIAADIHDGKITFEDAASNNSICPSKENGGEIGYFKHGMMTEEFDKAAFSLPINELSKPVKTQFGYHILIVTDKTAPDIMPFDEVSKKIKENLTSLKQQELYDEKLNELKTKYNVTINKT